MRSPLMSCDGCGEDTCFESERGTSKVWSGRAFGFVLRRKPLIE